MSTKITEVTFLPLPVSDKGLIGLAACVFDGKLKLDGIAIYTRPDGSDYRLVFPRLPLPYGREANIFYPIDKETGLDLKLAIVNKIREVYGKNKPLDDGETHYEPCFE